MGDALAHLARQRFVALVERLGGVTLVLGHSGFEANDLALDALALGHHLGQLRLGLGELLLGVTHLLIKDTERLVIDDGLAGLCGSAAQGGEHLR